MSALAISASLLALAGQCIPPGGDSLGTLLTFAHAESGLSPLAIHDNTMGGAILPTTKEAAVATATALIAAGHSIDLGFMQITSRNLPRLGLTVREVRGQQQRVERDRAGDVRIAVARREPQHTRDQAGADSARRAAVRRARRRTVRHPARRARPIRCGRAIFFRRSEIASRGDANRFSNGRAT